MICLPFDNLLSKKLVMNFGCNVKIYFLFSGDPLETVADSVKVLLDPRIFLGA